MLSLICFSFYIFGNDTVGRFLGNFKEHLSELHRQCSTPLSLLRSFDAGINRDALDENAKEIYDFVYKSRSLKERQFLFDYFKLLSNQYSLISGKLRCDKFDHDVGYVTLIFLSQGEESTTLFDSLFGRSTDNGSHAALVFEYLGDDKFVRYRVFHVLGEREDESCASPKLYQPSNVLDDDKTRDFVIRKLLFGDLEEPHFVRYYPYKSIPVRKQKMLAVVQKSAGIKNLGSPTCQSCFGNCCHYAAYILSLLGVGFGPQLIQTPNNLRELFDSTYGIHFRKPVPTYQVHERLTVTKTVTEKEYVEGTWPFRKYKDVEKKKTVPATGLYSCHWPFFLALFNAAAEFYFQTIRSDSEIPGNCSNFYYNFYLHKMRLDRIGLLSVQNSANSQIEFLKSIAAKEKHKFEQLNDSARNYFDVPLYARFAEFCFQREQVSEGFSCLEQACKLLPAVKAKVFVGFHQHFVGKEKFHHSIEVGDHQTALANLKANASENLELYSTGDPKRITAEMISAILACKRRFVRIKNCYMDEIAFLHLVSDEIQELPPHDFQPRDRHKVEIIDSDIVGNDEKDTVRIRWFQNLVMKGGKFTKTKGNYCRQSFFLDVHFVEVKFAHDKKKQQGEDVLHFYRSRLHNVSFTKVENLELDKEELCPSSIYHRIA